MKAALTFFARGLILALPLYFGALIFLHIWNETDAPIFGRLLAASTTAFVTAVAVGFFVACAWDATDLRSK